MKTEWCIWKPREVQFPRNLSRTLCYYSCPCRKCCSSSVAQEPSPARSTVVTRGLWLSAAGMWWRAPSPPWCNSLSVLWYTSVIWRAILANVFWKKKWVSSPTSILIRLIFLIIPGRPDWITTALWSTYCITFHLWWPSPSSRSKNTFVGCFVVFFFLFWKQKFCTQKGEDKGREEHLGLRWLWLFGYPVAAACLARGRVHHSVHPGICVSNKMLPGKNLLYSVLSH